jgi:5-enolpyruvylshikimate-3-phosphate synthase
MKRSKMIARAIGKRDVQSMIKALRAAGLEVTKEGMKYECRSPSGELLFMALNGRNNYLVRMRRDLFV